MNPDDSLVDILRNLIHRSSDPRRALETLRYVLGNGVASNIKLARPQHLREIIEIDQKLLKLYPPLDADYISKCGDLSDDFYSSFLRTNSKSDLAKAVYFSRLFVALSSPRLPGMAISLVQAKRLVRASVIIGTAAVHHESTSYFDEALLLARTATTVKDTEDVEKSFFLKNLACVLRSRFDTLGQEQDLKKTIGIVGAIVAAARKRDEGPTRMESFQYGDALFCHWRIYRDASDLQRAMKEMDDAITAPGDSDAELRSVLLGYAHWLFEVYRYHPRVEHLNKIEDMLNRASKISTESLDSQLSHIVALGFLYDIKAERSDDARFAQASLDVYKKGLGLAPRGSEGKTILVNNLIHSSIRLCIDSKAGSDKIKAYLDDVESLLAQEDLRNDPGILLGSARLQFLWYQQKSSGDSGLIEAKKRVDKAIQQGDKVFSKMALLGVPILNEYYCLTHREPDFESAYALILQLWRSPSEGPHEKVWVAKYAAEILHEAGKFKEAWKFLQEAVEILVLAYPRDLPKQDQRFMISSLWGLSNDACALGIAADVDKSDVLQTLEKGRGLAVSLSHRANEDLQRLSPDLRELLAKFEDSKARVYYNDLISSLQLGTNGKSLLREETMRRHCQKELTELSAKVKEFPELQMILDVPIVKSFQDLSANGPIVVVNNSKFRNDVILVTATGISTFQLDANSPMMVQKYGGQVTLQHVARTILKSITRGDELLQRNIMTRNKILQGMLMWLWDYVVKRVCQELNLLTTTGASENLQRIWWLPTGFFTQMPFHAAGDFLDDMPSETMLDRAISSYISSFRMLKWAQSRSKNIPNTPLNGMLVTMAAGNSKRTPQNTIFVRTAYQEVYTVQKEATKISWLWKDKASAADTMTELPQRAFLHFCCHGESHPDDASLSHLKLFKRVVGHDDDPLNVDKLDAGSISSALSDNAVLAVLSACYTTEIRDFSHLDEGLQLCNAFQIAGFPHVIGSRWAVSDAVCPGWSEKFYSQLNDSIEAMPLRNAHIAVAYHAATVAIFKQYPELAILWAPFVHIGP
ncbi:MAG: hypothetical protein GOMPHAMPRED_000214 [Gomphillus americanus]|uniref:CHAT domain-containing protein n=1 Tax=Gomphillus americanus TaxID=1940652 RepID=A0A8H3EAC5_9LECA|nr:MAG: hypothetical protein GOMPHAMPRED_000214 [Gomphillus americanus]